MDDVTNHLTNSDKRRIAFAKHMKERSGNERLQSAWKQLTSTSEVRKAAGRGIFLSYSRADEVFAFDLAVKLRDKGARIWMDMLNVRESDDWYDQVATALASSGLMIAVISAKGMQDANVKKERARFQAAGKLVQPVVADNCDTSGLRYWLQPIDLNQDYEAGTRRLYKLLGIDT